mmetsp:Transcript_40266/g.95665  ORF Transcript_40266/g.95665 Transcript_40266/m.95665 type:complete len:247 (-) Transcript_40266:222-962(-)
MSDLDFKTAFRSKVKSAKPSKEQLRALKAKKGSKSGAAPVAEFKVPSPRAPSSSRPAPAEPLSRDLRAPGRTEEALEGAAAAEAAAPSARDDPARAREQSAAAAEPKRGVLPVGFYADSDADKRARGESTKKRSIEEEMADFQASIAGDLEAAEEREQEDAADEATEREERDRFEQSLRERKVQELRELAKDGPKPKALRREGPDVRSRRQKALDLLAGVGSGSEDESGASGDEGGELLDWRAKGV